MDFSSLLPYSDAEVPIAVKTIAKNDLFSTVVRQINPELDVDEFLNQFVKIRTVDEFQRYIMLPLILHIVKQTTDGFTVSGLEQLDHDKGYLFVANHRDISLDVSLLCIQMLRHNFRLPAISFGDNLIANPFVKSLTRLNRMFPVFRGGTRREFYESSILMSNYIQYMLFEERRSVWIAQRNGRTKDGDDRTEPGLLKMLSMAGEGNFVEKMSRLNIVPLCISYEYEPCADSKAREMSRRAQGEEYVKRHGEDILHIWEGVSQQKGKVHLAVAAPITKDELQQCQDNPLTFFPKGQTEDVKLDLNTPYQSLAHLIDRRIWTSYQITGMNKLAYDIITGTANADIIYSAKMLFRSEMMLRIYAQPLINQKSLES